MSWLFFTKTSRNANAHSKIQFQKNQKKSSQLPFNFFWFTPKFCKIFAFSSLFFQKLRKKCLFSPLSVINTVFFVFFGFLIRNESVFFVFFVLLIRNESVFFVFFSPLIRNDREYFFSIFFYFLNPDFPIFSPIPFLINARHRFFSFLFSFRPINPQRLDCPDSLDQCGRNKSRRSTGRNRIFCSVDQRCFDHVNAPHHSR